MNIVTQRTEIYIYTYDNVLFITRISPNLEENLVVM